MRKKLRRCWKVSMHKYKDNTQFYNELHIRKIKQLGNEKEVKHCLISDYYLSPDLANSWYWTLRAKKAQLPKGMYDSFSGSNTLLSYYIDKNNLQYVGSKTRHKFKTLNRNLKYRKVLGDLQEIFYKIVSKYQDIKAVNDEGIVIVNFNSYKSNTEPKTRIDCVGDIDKSAFTVVKYFSELQDIGFNEKIPEYILEFIEKQKSLDLLEG